MSYLGFWGSSSNWREAITSRKSHCLMRSLVENDIGTTVTVNSGHYGHMITDFFLPVIDENDMENIRFQQDGATCHSHATTRANMALLQETFRGRIISHRGYINWPPRSYNLTPVEFFFFFFCGTTLYSWAFKNLYSSSYGEDNAQYVSLRKLPQKSQCLQHFTWRLFKWCRVCHNFNVQTLQ